MPLVTTKQMLLDAQAGNYAVGAFNVENMEMVMAVMESLFLHFSRVNRRIKAHS